MSSRRPLRRVNHYKLFLRTVAISTVCCLGLLYAKRAREFSSLRAVHPLGNNVLWSPQITPAQLSYLLRRHEIKTVVDVRPDGEAADQPSSGEISAAASRMGLKFHYIPVPHESIPDEAVQHLSAVLADRNATPETLLYCRTGRRAVRLYALEEASRPDGPDAEKIIAMIRGAGFPFEDLRSEISLRITQRNAPAAPQP